MAERAIFAFEYKAYHHLLIPDILKEAAARGHVTVDSI
jgi:hypothetical protein